MKLSAWRVALRIARRDALRAKGRSALVIAMIAIPVLGVTGADVAARSAQLSVQESSTRLMGGADAVVTVQEAGWRVEQAPNPDLGAGNGVLVPSDSGDKPHPTARETARGTEPLAQLLKQALPAGAELVPLPPGAYVSTSTRYGQENVSATELDLADPLTHGIVTLRQGSWPKAPHQVAATTEFLSSAGLHVGQTTTLTGSGQPLTITAAVELPGDLQDQGFYLRPGELAGLLTAAGAHQDPGAGTGTLSEWLVKLPGTAGFDWDQVQHANGYGFSVASRSVLASPPPDSDVPLFRDPNYSPSAIGGSDHAGLTIVATVVGMALLEIVLLAGPAFAVGARRSRRQLGLLAAGGGDRGHIRGVVLGGGVVLGTAGAVVGVVLGAVAVALGRGWLEDQAGTRFGHFSLQPLDLVGIVSVGLVTGLLAAVVPAVQAARQDVVASLTGRGTIKPPPIWLTGLGAVAFAGGTILALAGSKLGQPAVGIMGGSIVAELGVVACTPFLVGVFGRLGRRLPLVPRMALRDSVRHRGRTAPAVAAVMAAVAGAVAVSIFQSSLDAQDQSQYSAGVPARAVVLQLESSRPDAGLAEQQQAAVERSMTGLGQRADVYRVYYSGDCAGDDRCGDVAVTLPADRVCAAFAGAGGDDGRPLPVFSNAAIKKMEQTDPRCRSGAQVDFSPFGTVVAGNAAVLHNMLGIDNPAAVQALAQGKVLVPDIRFVEDGKATLTLQTEPTEADPDLKPSTRTLQVPAFPLTAQMTNATTLMSTATAQRLGLPMLPGGSVWLPRAMPASAQEQRAAAAAGRIAPSDVSVERGYQSTSGVFAIGLAIAASVVAVAAAAIATGLAAADSQADLATLAAVGAAPRIRRTLSGFQCAVIAGMGVLMGLAAGVVPAAALWPLKSGNGGTGYNTTSGLIDTATVSPLVVSWSTIGLMLVGLPVLAWLLAAGFTRSKVVLTRRTA